MSGQKNYAALILFRGAQMRESHRIVFDQLAQCFRGRAVKLAELSEQPAQCIKATLQQTFTLPLAHFRKSQPQIGFTSAPESAGNQVGDTTQATP